MKFSLLLFFLFMLFASVTYKPKTDCDYTLRVKFYKKGKLVKEDFAEHGFWQTTGANIWYEGKKVKCDSLYIEPNK